MKKEKMISYFKSMCTKAYGIINKNELIKLFTISFITNIIIESFNMRGLLGIAQIFVNPIVFLYNTLVIMLTMSISLFVIRKSLVYFSVGILWITGAITDFIVLSSRKTPFTAMDMRLIKDAIKVMPLYVNVFQMVLIVMLIISVIALIVIVWKKAPKADKRKKWYIAIIDTAVIAVIVAVMTTVLVSTNILGRNFGNLAKAYKQYGFVYCFSCSLVGSGISKSNDYSEEYMEDLKNEIDAGDNENTEKRPNIIFLQLESFFDPTTVIGTEYSSDPIPCFRELFKNYSSGYLSVPIFGAGTVNTEFEVQTGINLDDFGPGEYPYKTVLQSKTCESMAYDLKNLGYSAHAIHDNDATFYNRNKVFSNLGYDTFTSIEYMDNYTTTPMGWCKDEVLVNEIKKSLDSTDNSDYIYTISVQGHGDYPDTMPEGYEPTIKVDGFFDKDAQVAFEYYVNQISEMDLFIKSLVDMLSERDEETILVMYGDHLPTFSFTDEKLTSGDIYKTQYIIWDNMELNHYYQDLEAYQLAASVFKRINITEGIVTKFHQRQCESPDYLKNLKILGYDMLYGEQDVYGGQSPYEPSDLKMGTNPIKITSVYNYGDHVCVEGENFNKFSYIYVNNKEYQTTIINDKLLIESNVLIKPGDIVSVAQKGKDKKEISIENFTVSDSEEAESEEAESESVNTEE